MTGCRRGREVQQAAGSGRWSADVRAHVTDCRMCREVAQVAEMLASAPVPPPSVVNPAALWVRARHARRLSAEAAVSRIITAGQIGAGLFGIGLLVVLGAQVETWPVFTPTVQYGAWMMGATGLAAAAILAMTRRHN